MAGSIAIFFVAAVCLAPPGACLVEVCEYPGRECKVQNAFLLRVSASLRFLLTLTLLSAPAVAQDWAKPSIGQLQRLDLRDLGYPMVNEIPANSSAITALLAARDGKVYLMAGERSSARPCQAYCYDPAGGGFTELGLLIVDRSPYRFPKPSSRLALRIGTVTDDGPIQVGYASA